MEQDQKIEKPIVLIPKNYVLLTKECITCLNEQEYKKQSGSFFLLDYYVFNLSDEKSFIELEYNLKKILFKFLESKNGAEKALQEKYLNRDDNGRQELINGLEICDKNIKIIQKFLNKNNMK